MLITILILLEKKTIKVPEHKQISMYIIDNLTINLLCFTPHQR